jgi:DNA-binding transcriptional regulator YiaG
VPEAALSPEEIRSIREAAGLSQRALSKKLGVSVNSISNWETGSTSPRQESVRKLLGMRK